MVPVSVHKRSVIALATLLTVIGAAVFGYQYWRHRHDPPVAQRPVVQSVLQGPVNSATPSPAQPTPEASSSLPPPATPPAPPASALIQTVPFTIQAPFEKWDPAHEEYCEAAVVYMVGQYLSGDRRSRLPPAEADAALGRIVAWERASYPGVINLPLTAMAQVGSQFYKLDAEIQPVSFEAIKQSLADGLPVIVPVMTHGGPGGSRIYPTYGKDNVYHTLVLVGYDTAQGVVYANDPGLREGLSLRYGWSTLSAAIGAQSQTRSDSAGKVPSEQGSIMMVFRPRR